MVCFLAEARDLHSVQNIRPTLGTFVLLFSGCRGMKPLIHEADHSPLFPVEVTDQYGCNCASPECLHGMHRDIFTFYHCVGGMASISAGMSCQNSECCYLMIGIEHGRLETSVHVGFSFCVLLFYCLCLWPFRLL